MQQKLFIRGTLFFCLLNISNTQKFVLFNNAECSLRSNKLDKVDCFVADGKSLTLEITTNNIVVMNLVGVANLKFYGHRHSKPANFKGFRIEICKILSSRMRPSMVSFIYDGILGADNNLPAKCPFNRNTTYAIRRIKFSSKFLPSMLSEGDFTFNATFWGNNVALFDVNSAGSLCNVNHDCTGSGNVTTS